MRYLIHANHLGFSLCLLAALHTSCSNVLDRLAFGSDDEPVRSSSASSHADMLEDKENSKGELCELLLSKLAYRGTQRIGLHEDRYDPECFKESMWPVIEGDASAQGVQYRYIRETASILLVAIHYSKDEKLVEYLLGKDAHKDLSKEDIQECLKAVVTNPFLKGDNEKSILQLLITAFKESSGDLLSEPGCFDELLTHCPTSSIHDLITVLIENEIDVYQVDDQGNTLLHRLCKHLVFTDQMKKFWEELLKLPGAQVYLTVKNNEGKTPEELLVYPVPKLSLEKGERCRNLFA